MSYLILRERHLDSLRNEVYKLLKDGWTPQGGITIDNLGLEPNVDGAGGYHYVSRRYLQVMVKPD
jgi:hypothetical protein